MTDNEPTELYVPAVGACVRITHRAYDDHGPYVGDELTITDAMRPHEWGVPRRDRWLSLTIDGRDTLCRVAPASLAAEQRPWKVGDRAIGFNVCTGERIEGTIEQLSRAMEAFRYQGDDAPTAIILGTHCFVAQLRPLQPEPPSAKRPECEEWHGFRKGERVRWTKLSQQFVLRVVGPAPLSEGGGDGWLFLEREDGNRNGAREDGYYYGCVIGEHVNIERVDTSRQLASGSAGSVQREQCESGSSALNRTEKPATEPTVPGRPSRDPYAEHRLHIEHDMGLKTEDEIADATAIQGELRRATWTNKQRQAAEMLLRPARPKVYRKAPSTWPDDAWRDARSCDP